MGATPNRSRVRVYDAAELAEDLARTFTGRKGPVPARQLGFRWPATWQHVGDSLAVAYLSDKWDRDWTMYKHLAESRNRALVVPGLLHEFDDPRVQRRTIGPRVSLVDVPMPKDWAVLARFEELNLQLHTHGSNERPEFGEDEDDGVVKVVVRHAWLAGSLIQWSEVDEDRPNQPFLCIFTKGAGPLALIVGEELDIEPDGIVG